MPTDDLFGDSDEEGSVKIADTQAARAGSDSDLFDSESDAEKTEKKTQRKANKLRPGKKQKRIPKKRLIEKEHDSDDEIDETAVDLHPKKVKRSKQGKDADSDNEAVLNDLVSEDEQNSVEKIKVVKKTPTVKGDDPLSEMLRMNKRTKPKDISDEEKTSLVTGLCSRMEKATREDQQDRQAGKPALHKLALLPTVEQAVATAYLHQFLLENGFLKLLADWIAPADDSNALPPLSLRTSVYKMLQVLPCSAEELKHSQIGKNLFRLRKNPNETAVNKALLKLIMEKWSRLIFNKSTSIVGTVNTSEELRATLAATNATISRTESQHQSGASFFGAVDSNPTQTVSSLRARAPVSHGFLFTVPLENTDLVGQSKHVAKPIGENREMLLKIVSDGTAAGRKANNRLVPQIKIISELTLCFPVVLYVT
jgi:hypothetical protein